MWPFVLRGLIGLVEQVIYFVVGYYSMDALIGVRQMISGMRFEAPGQAINGTGPAAITARVSDSAGISV